MAGNSHDHNARWRGTRRAHPIIPLGHFRAQFSRAPPEPRDIQIIYKSEWVGSGPGWIYKAVELMHKFSGSQSIFVLQLG